MIQDSNTDASDALLQRLGDLLGREAHIEGRSLRVIEVLREGPTLILQEAGRTALQEDIYGRPRRHAPRHFHVALLSELGDRLHPIARQFMHEEEAALLERWLIEARQPGSPSGRS